MHGDEGLIVPGKMNWTSDAPCCTDNESGVLAAHDLHQLSAPPDSTEIMSLTIATLAVILTLGTAGNVVVCLVITLYSQMRTVFNILVLNLALTDLLLGIVVAPTFIARIVYEICAVAKWTATPTSHSGIATVCHISAFTHYVCTSQSLLTMIQMGIIRAIAVSKSARSHRFRISKLIPCGLIAINYVISVSFSLCTYSKGTHTFCFDESMRATVGVRLSSLAILVGTLVLISASYVWIFKTTRTQRVGFAADLAGAAPVRRQTNRFDIATARTLLLVVGTYGVSYLPYMVFISAWVGGMVEDDPHTMVIFPALTSLCSVANPVIYALSSAVFRRQMLRMFRLDKIVLRRTVPAIAVRPPGNPAFPPPAQL